MLHDTKDDINHMKILKTIRVDDSDKNIFDQPAEPGEIAITGSFAFSDKVFSELDRKGKIAYQSAWLGIGSFGNSTFVEVQEVEESDLDQAQQKLAVYFVQNFGAPSIADALPVAQDELNYSVSLCEFDAGTILAIERTDTPEGIKESIRMISQPEIIGATL